MVENMKKGNEVPKLVGKCVFKDLDAFAAWYRENGNEYYSTARMWSKQLYPLQEGKGKGLNLAKVHGNMNGKSSWESWSDYADKNINTIRPFQEYATEFGQYFDVLLIFKDADYDEENIVVSLSPNKEHYRYLIPARFLDITLINDYSDYTPAQLLASKGKGVVSGETGLTRIDALDNVSQSAMRERVAKGNEVAAQMKARMDSVKNATCEELASLQAEIDEKIRALEAKKADMMAVLNAKKEEMDKALMKLEKQVFMLDSEIYSIRCFLGETVDFVKVKGGVNAPVEQPVVLYQKVRYLDEELGKMAGIYNVDFGEAKLFERFVANNLLAFDTFCPSSKCITLIRVSKSVVAYATTNDPLYGTMVEMYEKFHGGKIGIMIRNGENLYLGWTDEEKISISEDMFFSPSDIEISPVDEKYHEQREKNDREQMRSQEVTEAVSRYFIFSILQGIVENTDMLKIPETESFLSPQKYIVYSAADAWLVDNRFGSFADIVKKCNSHIAVGHPVMVLNGCGDGYYSGSWGGSRVCQRDHNFSQRTVGCATKEGEIYRINLVEKDEKGDEDYFVSICKDGCDYVYRNGRYVERLRDAYARFRVYPSEVVNLNYMNSVWLSYVICNRNLGFARENGNYARMIQFLNKALDFVRDREKTEREYIKAVYEDIDGVKEWQVTLSEWKIANNVNEFTPWQAKRFAKALQKVELT